MKQETEQKVKEWIDQNMVKSTRLLTSYNSYSLKQMCENKIGKYVSNEDFIRIVRSLGFDDFRSSIRNPNVNFYCKLFPL